MYHHSNYTLKLCTDKLHHMHDHPHCMLRSLITAVLLIRGDCYQTSDATFITDSTSKRHMSVHTSMYSYCDDTWNITFVDNSPSKSLIPVVSSTCSDGDHACDATFITDSTSKTFFYVHSSMYSDYDKIIM